MGITVVILKVRNPKDERRLIEEKFLVDSGASFSVVPGPLLDKIGIKPRREQEFTLADGTTIKRKVSEAVFEYRGNRATSPVVIGKKNDSLLLGTITLETMGLVLDPFERKIYKAKLII
jgi:clan AA aspartic protease